MLAIHEWHHKGWRDRQDLLPELAEAMAFSVLTQLRYRREPSRMSRLPSMFAASPVSPQARDKQNTTKKIS